MKPIFVLNNPRLLASSPCASGFTGIPSWYPTSTEMLAWFLQPCTNYTVPDATYLAGEAQTPQACLLPVVPQPVPDGAGVLAVSDYGYAAGSVYVNPDYKSFASTCLTQTLQKDSLYRLDFYAGFGAASNKGVQFGNQVMGPEASSTPEIIGLFGMTDCSAVGNPIPQYSCIDRAGWIPLGEVKVGGLPGTWTKASILFTPPVNINSIAIGPSCDTNFTTGPFAGTFNGISYDVNRYSFFLDSLQFYGGNAPPPVITLVSGDSCTSTAILEMQPGSYYAASTLQWYRNDTLMAGQRDSVITIPRRSLEPDSFRCVVMNDSLCLVSNPVIIDWAPLAPHADLGSADTTVCQLDTLFLSASPNGSYTYAWQDGSTNPYFEVTRDGIYSVTLTNTCGSSRAEKTVQFVACDDNAYVPNAFTPNDDGKNDRFRVHFFHPPKNFSLSIFNRTGLKLYSAKDPSEGWDGRYKNTPQPAGGYVWYIDYTDYQGKHHSMRGTLILIR